jgi:hypothetical protein
VRVLLVWLLHCVSCHADVRLQVRVLLVWLLLLLLLLQ